MKSKVLFYLFTGTAALAPLRAQAQPQSLFRSIPATDPNREPNWDFWTNRSYAPYYYKDGAIHQTQAIQLPYFTSYHPTWPNDGQTPDVFPVDGWMLVIRDFGTPTSAPAFPYFALYNKYRGILRFFFLNTYNLANSQYATSVQLFNPSQEQYRSALLTFPAESKCFLKDYDSAQQIYTLSNMTLNGWSHYDFILSGYDPSLKAKPYVSLDVKTFGLNVTNLKMTGNIYGTVEQMMNSAPTSFGKSDLETLEAALGKGYSYYKSTNDAMKALKQQTDDQSNKDAWWYQAALKLVTSYFTGGTASYASWIAGAVGFLTEYIGGENKAAPMQPLNFSVKLNLEATGTLTSSTWIDSPGFYLNYLANPQPGQVSPVQAIPWGVFNVEEAPEVTVQPVYRPRFGPINPQDGTRSVYPVLGGYKATVTKVPGVIINPETGMATQSLKYAFKYESRGPSAFVDATLPLSLQTPGVPSGLTYELKAQLPDASMLRNADPVQVFYKTVPYRKVDGEPIGWFEPYAE